jgi:exosortase E/protease (VPEID-CTERM system)
MHQPASDKTLRHPWFSPTRLGHVTSGVVQTVQLKAGLFRVLLFVMTFVLQGLWLTLQFDTGNLTDQGAFWAAVFDIVPQLPRIGLSFLIMLVLVARSRLISEAIQLNRAVLHYAPSWAWWASHWCAFLGLTYISSVLFPEIRSDTPVNPVCIVGWFAFAAITLLSLALAVAPRSYWKDLTRREHQTLAISLGCAVIAVPGGRLFQQLWQPLSDATYQLVRFWLSLLYGQQIVADHAQHLLGTNNFVVHIAPACSGYEGMGLISLFSVVFLFAFRDTLRFPRAFLLWPIGVLAIWLFNTVRIASLIVIGTEYSSSLALGGFHSQAGWLLFNLVSAGLMFGACKSPWFCRDNVTSRGIDGPAAGYLAPFLALTGLSMLLSAILDDPAPAYPLLVVLTAGLLWKYKHVLTWTWSVSSYAVLHGVTVFVLWIGLAVMDTSAQSRTVLIPGDSAQMQSLWIAFRILGSVVTVPLVEELAFRGFLMRRLGHADFETQSFRSSPFWAVLVSSLAFGFMHQMWIGGILAGISYSLVAQRRGNLGDAVIAHGVTNGMIAITVLTTGATWLW